MQKDVSYDESKRLNIEKGIIIPNIFCDTDVMKETIRVLNYTLLFELKMRETYFNHEIQARSTLFSNARNHSCEYVIFNLLNPTFSVDTEVQTNYEERT